MSLFFFPLYRLDSDLDIWASYSVQRRYKRECGVVIPIAVLPRFPRTQQNYKGGGGGRGNRGTTKLAAEHTELGCLEEF